MSPSKAETAVIGTVTPAMLKFGAGAVKPQGWLRDRAIAARDGLTGHMDDVSIHFKRAWTQEWQPRGEYLDWCGSGDGSDYSWSSEGGAYWFDGLVRLSRQLDDPELRDLADRRMAPLLNNMNPNSIGFLWWLDRRDSAMQEEVDTKGRWQYWVQGISERPIAAYYEATGDIRAKNALEWAFSDPALCSAKGSGATFFSGLADAARITGSPVLRANVAGAIESLVAKSQFSTPPTDATRDTLHYTRRDIDTRHGVAACEQLLSLFRTYMFTGDEKIRDSVLAWYDFFDKYCAQPYGVTMMDEEWGWAGAKRGTETCDVAAEPYTRMEIFAALGDGKWGDTIELAQFNAAPMTVSRDFKNHIYFQLPNRVADEHEADLFSCGNFRHTVYALDNWPLCCSAALNRILPNYIQSMWMKTSEGGLAATLYGPCTFAADINSGKFEVEEVTDYPFSDKIEIKVKSAPAGELTVSFRIPGWAKEYNVAVNGQSVNTATVKGFVRISREWKAGDIVTLSFPMIPRVKTICDMNDGGKQKTSVYVGPLLMAYAFPEKDENTPAADICEPVITEKEMLAAEIVRSAMPAKWSWKLEEAPVRLKLHDVSGNPLELIPYGCSKLHISMFTVDSSDSKI